MTIEEQKMNETEVNKKPESDKQKQNKEEELSEEDLQLKEEIEMLLERLKDVDFNLHRPALEALRTILRTSTTSMTSVPKPLKFLRPYFNDLVEIFESWLDTENKSFLSDIISVVAMTTGQPEKRLALKYRLTGSLEPYESWGHEYLRHLCMELMHEFDKRAENEQPTDELLAMVKEMIPFFLKHNAEAEACDILADIGYLDELLPFVDEDNYDRIGLYLETSACYVPYPDDREHLTLAFEIYKKLGRYSRAMVIAIRMSNIEIIKDTFNSCPDQNVRRQLAFMLARDGIIVETSDELCIEIMNNARLSKYFIALAKELEIMDPKLPEDIYKSHLEQSRYAATIDSAKQNLASAFVNAFVNAGFGKDKLILEENGTWLYRNKEHGIMSAATSIGAIIMWDIDLVTKIDKYLYATEEYVKAGAMMAIGITNTRVRNEYDPALYLLSEYVEQKSPILNIGAILGLGFAYAGTAQDSLKELLLPLVSNSELNLEISGMTALSLGLIFSGTMDGDISSTILQTMMERDTKQLSEPAARFLALGLALLFIAKGQNADPTIEAAKVVEAPIGKQAATLVEAAAYAGSGDVLKIQEFMQMCTEHIDKTKKNDEFQGFAVLGIGLIAMSEEIGCEMAVRLLNHLIHYGEPVVRRVAPLALGLIYASNPQHIAVLETLSKYSHDLDGEVAMSAIFAMGLVGAGTNNARLAQMLRQLASYYNREPNNLFMVRIAQGLLHMGKGTMTLNPYHSHRTIMSEKVVAGLFVVLTCLTDIKNTILGKHPYLLFFLLTSVYPRFLITLDENLNELPVPVRVGQAVDTIGQAGRPKTITGFQTHTTPVLLSYGERAELATDEYIPYSHILENFVILRKNPDYEEPMLK